MSSKPYPFAPPPPQPSRAASSSATVNHHNSASAAVGSNAAASKSSAAVVQDPAFVPRDARLMSILLSATGVEAAEPHVVPLLLEWMNRYTLQVLADAQAFADHRMSAASGAGALSDFIRSEDVKLAISANTQHSFMAPPSKEFLLELAERKNSQPLPLISERYGLRMPQDRFCLTAPNFEIVPKKVKTVQPDPTVITSTKQQPAFTSSSISSTSSSSALPFTVPKAVKKEKQQQQPQQQQDEDYDMDG